MILFGQTVYIVSSKIMLLEQRLSLIPSEGQQLSRDTSAIVLPYTKQLLVRRMQSHLKSFRTGEMTSCTYISCTNILHTGHKSWLMVVALLLYLLQPWSKLFITLSYFVVFCCADFCFSFMLYCIHIILLIITTDTHKLLVQFILSDLLVLLFGDPFFFFLYRNACCFIIHYCCCFFFLIYSVLNVFILMHVDFVFIQQHLRQFVEENHESGTFKSQTQSGN